MRLSQQRLRLLNTPTDATTQAGHGNADPETDSTASKLPSVQRLAAAGVLALPGQSAPAPPEMDGPAGLEESVAGGDDDTDDELEGDEDFYADVMDSA